jgi:hypothetical protein
MKFEIAKHNVYTVTCGDINLSHIVIENHGGSMYAVYSYGEEIDIFDYRGDKPLDAIHDYLETYAKENGYA